ncbi:MAG: phage antirepressor KilAC domain-containing protein [Clostridia bacterium]|nr:phage antirepressor KilAC domain-containing protein [Clostridia bacterium]
MDNNLAVFNSEEFGELRTIMIEGEPWFVANDVCTILDINRTQTRRLDDDEKGVCSMHTPGGEQNVGIVNEYGLYNLILGSRKPEAKAFRRWITHEVLPSIRRHGVYATNSALKKFLDNPELIMELGAVMLRERDRANALSDELKIARPKAEYFDTFISPGDCTNIRNTAKELQVPERQFCRFLLESRLMYRSPAGTLMPYSKSQKDGLFIVKDFYSKSGFFGAYSLITPKGKDLIRTMLCKAAG